MIAVEAWLAMLAATAVAAPTPPSSTEPGPAVELLEFIGDWNSDEGRLIDDFQRPAGDEARENDNDMAKRSPAERRP